MSDVSDTASLEHEDGTVYQQMLRLEEMESVLEAIDELKASGLSEDLPPHLRDALRTLNVSQDELRQQIDQLHSTLDASED